MLMLKSGFKSTHMWQKGKSMKMKDIMENKGIEWDNNYLYYYLPANGRCKRRGCIRKEIVLYSPSDACSSVLFSTLGVEINTEEGEIEVRRLKGSMPLVKNLCYALLADRDVRRMILEYQELKVPKKCSFKVWKTEGASGRKDIFLTKAERIGGFAVTRTKKICHISCAERLNEGFGIKNKMGIQEFVEMCAFLGFTAKGLNVKALRKKAGVKYIRPKYEEEVDDFREEVSKIL